MSLHTPIALGWPAWPASIGEVRRDEARDGHGDGVAQVE
jgi:hypothetical protein